MIEKACAFYVSKIHLATMLIPYINKQINNGIKIETFLEEDLEKNIESVLEKIISDNENKNKIKKINWNEFKTNKKNIENKIYNILSENPKINIIINGKEKYMKNINEILNKILKQNINVDIRIINCFSVDIVDENIEEIVNTHNMLLNTAGMENIEKFFEKTKTKSLIN